MKRIILFLLALAIMPATALAHALEGQLLLSEPVVVVNFVYSTGDAARFVKAEVFAPSDASIEFQTGRTDKRGNVTFFPDEPGLWRVVVADNQGHRAEFEINVSPESTLAGQGDATRNAAFASSDTAVAPGRGMKVALGLSLILNLALGGLVWSRRTRKRRNLP